MNGTIASALKRVAFTVFAALAAIQIAHAQTGWTATRAQTTGDLVAVYFTSSDDGWIAGDKGYLARTGDGGKSWTQQNLNTDENINEIYFRNDDNGYLVAGKKMFLTRDGGKTWQETRIFNATDFKNLTPEFLSIRFPDKKLGFVVGSLLNKNEEVVESLVMRTEDGGETWSRVAVTPKVELYHLDFVNKSSGWIVGDKGMILMTYDGGQSWIKQKSGTDRALYNVDFRNETDGCAVGAKGTILKTTDGGQNWTPIKTSFPATYLRVSFADDKNGWIVGYGGTILRSNDKGATWIGQTGDTKENLYGLYMTKKYGWAVGAKGAVEQYRK